MPVGRAEIDPRVGDGTASSRSWPWLPNQSRPTCARQTRLAVARPQRVETAVVGAEERCGRGRRRWRPYGPAGVEGPDRLAVDGAQAVDVALGVADVDRDRRTIVGDVSVAPSRLASSARWCARPAATARTSPSPDAARAAAARHVVEERLEHRAASSRRLTAGEAASQRRTCTVHRRRPVPRRDGDQVPVEARVVEVVERDRPAETRRAPYRSVTPVAPVRRPELARCRRGGAAGWPPNIGDDIGRACRRRSNRRRRARTRSRTH